MSRIVLLLSGLLMALPGCETRTEEPPPPDPCKEFFDIDAPAGDWMWARGSSTAPQPDTHYRIRFVRQGDTVKAWYVHDLQRYEMTGHRRELDWMFTSDVLVEDPEGFKAGNDDPAARYRVTAYLSIDKQCHVDWSDGYVTYLDGQETEKPDPMGRKTLAPVSDSTRFSYQPCSEAVVAAEGAGSFRAARRMIDSGTVPLLTGDRGTLAAWTDAATDGEDDCNYSFDYFWDGLLKDEGVATTQRVGEQRKWSHAIDLSSIGSHDVTFERYRACGSVERELIGVSCGLVQVQ